MKLLATLLSLFLFPILATASEADLKIPSLSYNFDIAGFEISGHNLLLWGIIIVVIGLGFGLFQYKQIKKLPVHRSMSEISNIIYETCKTYLLQQGRFLILLELIIGSAIFYYFFWLNGMGLAKVFLVIGWSILGILGSYTVAWFGIRINTIANCRTSFAALKKLPFDVMGIPLKAGMSVGILLIGVELIMMLLILLFVPGESAGACFIGFAIGESLGASALRIAGGIFTKIADIGSDLMKIAFNIKEDDPRNPGVIADCTGDNAGDSVGPTADGFETYGVTGVALISFIVLAAGLGIASTSMEITAEIQSKLIVWIFSMRILMVFTSMFSYWINNLFSKKIFGHKESFNFEAPLTNLVWVTSIISIIVTYIVSYLLIGSFPKPDSGVDTNLWWKLATIISFGTIAAAIIPELTKVFTSSRSRHVNEIVTASREGGPSLTILSGIVAGNFSAFWKGITIVAIMFGAYYTSTLGLSDFMQYPTIFAFGLVAFGFLGMGPVTIAVDSYGPVTDNAQSVFELSQITGIPGIKEEIKNDFGFEPDFIKGKHHLEANDSAGNTFKATAKPVLIGTAVIGATTMIFSIILLLKSQGILQISLTDAPILLGFIAGGAVIYWFSGASIQAVTTGAYRAVEYIKKHIKLDKKEASLEDSKEVVRICTQYAQSGMLNIFGVVFSITLAFAFFNSNFFVSYLISLAVFGLFQAMFMANAGGAWDNAKKVVEVDLKEKNTDLHAATVIGDTVGDPFKDTSAVALNPIIKFSTLFGLLAVEIAVNMPLYAPYLAVFFFIIALVFVYRSFYGMRIKKQQ